MKEKIKDFLKKNIVIFAFLLFSVLFEIIGICYIGGNPYLTKPLYYLIIIGLFTSALFLIKSNKVRVIITSLILFLQLIANVGFVYLYDSNGTFFEWAMFNQRNDAFAIIEELHLRWELVAVLSVLFVLYGFVLVLYAWSKKYKHDKYKMSKFQKIFASVMVGIFTITMLTKPAIDARVYSKKSYVERYLYGNGENKYQQLGMTANAVYEFFNGTITNALVNNYNDEGIEEFVYNDENPLLETSPYFGISKGNNLVYILVESFEWFVFVDNCTPEQSLALYPNINKFLNSSIYADNFYSREKTDSAEMLTIIGSNPTNGYINYDFYDNEYSWSLPNLFRDSVVSNGNTVKHVKSFHQNSGTFYNRNELHNYMGFDELISIEDMVEYGIEGPQDGDSWKRGEMTLDSLTIEKMQDEMFPITEENEQYMSFWITYIMHGSYNYNKKFEEEGYYAKLDEVGAYPEGNTRENYLRTYAASVMDFDKALGIMMDKLEANGQLDNTTIVMYADHNAYYNNLSGYAKGIEERYHSELYRIPFMIYDTKLKTQYVANEGNSVISKFTTTSDILPTVLDMFGIKGYRNLYYGTSMFIKDVESIIFSRAYGIFVTDKLICYSVDNLIYTSDDFTNADKESFIDRAEILLNKQTYLDKIYNTNYFKDNPLRVIQ